MNGKCRLSGIIVDHDTVLSCLSNLLVRAVHKDNPRQKDFIGNIMKMDKSQQKELKGIITEVSS